MQIPAFISNRPYFAPKATRLATARGTTTSGRQVEISVTETALVFDLPVTGQSFSIALDVLSRAALEAIDEQLQKEARR